MASEQNGPSSDQKDLLSESYAKHQDSIDPLKDLRKEFHIPAKQHLTTNRNALTPPEDKSEESTYLCGNSLGLQPRLTAQYQQEYLQTWAQKGVFGHFTDIEDSPLPPWLHVDDDVVEDMAKIVGAQKGEVAVMQTLTGNLHLALCSFFRPTKERYKIIIEGKAFPSDHYAIESQLHHHNLPASAMIQITPPTPEKATLTTEHILSVIDEHASSTALLLLPGIQFYTGQFFDIKTITAHAQRYGIVVGWDLAHAVGNVILNLHDCNVDFAVWCTYKYLNCGPGAIGGLFIHERHGVVGPAQQTSSSASANGEEEVAGLGYRPRLAGWWGSSKNSRFAMENRFNPIPGAAGWQLSNPSVADLTSLRASMDVFKKTSMDALHEKSLKLTGYLEELLHLVSAPEQDTEQGKERISIPANTFAIITPSSSSERGAQLSVRLVSGLLDTVMAVLEEEAVIVDERRPDVIRVAPAPLYNNHSDVLRFVTVFAKACNKALEQKKKGGESVSETMGAAGKEDKGWSEIK